MDPEEDHGHILGRCDAPSGKTTLTEICVPLHGGERVILRTWELLPLEDPTIKYLQMMVMMINNNNNNIDINSYFCQLVKSKCVEKRGKITQQ